MIHLEKYQNFNENTIYDLMNISDQLIEATEDYLVTRADIEIPEVKKTCLIWNEYSRLTPTLRNSPMLNSLGFIFKREHMSDENIEEMGEYLTTVTGKNIKVLRIYTGLSNDQHLVVSNSEIVDNCMILDKIYSSIMDYTSQTLDKFDSDDQFEIITDNNIRPYNSDVKLTSYIIRDEKEDNTNLLGNTSIMYDLHTEIERIVDYIELNINITNKPPEELEKTRKEETTKQRLKIPINATSGEVTKQITDFLEQENKNGRIIKSWG